MVSDLAKLTIFDETERLFSIEKILYNNSYNKVKNLIC